MRPARVKGLWVPLTLLALGLAVPARAEIPGWMEKNFGAEVQGSASVDANGVWTVKGAGADTWETEDQFYIVYKNLPGDGSVTTHVLSAQEGANPSKVGVMMRNDLEDVAAPVLQAHMTTSPGAEVLYRKESGGRMWMDFRSAKSDYRVFPRKVPIWFKIERRGDRFTPYASEDGALWTPITRSERIQMKSEIVAGVFVCSVDAGNLLTGTFDGKVTDVSNRLLKPEEATPAQPDPVIVLGGDNAVMLMWDRVNHFGKEADGYAIYKAKPGETNFTKIAEVPGNQPSYIDNTIKNGELAQYRVTTIVKVGVAADKVLESRDLGDHLYAVVGAPNPSPPIRIGDRVFSATLLEGGVPDVGDTNPVTEVPGSASIDANGVVTLRAAGWDIQERNDGGEQLVTPVTGDFTFTARVLGVPTAETGDVNEWAKFGIAVREGTLAESRYVAMLITPEHGIRSPHRRLIAGENSNDLGPNQDTPTFPVFFRIQRKGDEIKLFTSADGKTFAEYGEPATTVLPGLAPTAYVGFMGTSHDNDRPPNQIALAKFDQITLTTP